MNTAPNSSALLGAEARQTSGTSESAKFTSLWHPDATSLGQDEDPRTGQRRTNYSTNL